ncbi:MAG: sugar phosphate isomerase/epimerase family protein [Bryobacterales bacterium]|nr:sugar phosphate isomerase/epimerase [Bryobacteraceae bacterium]MDW8130474.1 sugar phosphate isomerase/epimerase family protein [Bryobacterales bacterium]
MSYVFKHATCNEGFKDWDFAQAAKAIRKAGYEGIELAPFTLAEDATTVPAEKRREYRRIIESEGLTFVGLHWLLVGPKDIHVTTPDRAIRERSWRYVHGLIDLCADLGEGGVMVFGSPKQRSSTGGLSPEEAKKHFVEGLAGLADHAAQRGVTVLVEALSPDQTDVVTSLAEAVEVVQAINHPAIRTMFDTHNAVAETEPHDVLVDRYFDLIRHVHVNEMDGRRPGLGDYDFKPVLRVLKRRNYQGWVSLEAFDFSGGPDKVVEESLRYLEQQIALL